jgi:hypothetical protein
MQENVSTSENIPFNVTELSNQASEIKTNNACQNKQGLYDCVPSAPVFSDLKTKYFHSVKNWP